MWYQFSGAYLAPLQKLEGYAIYRQPSYAYTHIDFNVTHPGVADPVVRRALLLALNRPEIVAQVAHGVGVVQDSATPVNPAVRSGEGERAAGCLRLETRLGWHSCEKRRETRSRVCN